MSSVGSSISAALSSSIVEPSDEEAVSKLSSASAVVDVAGGFTADVATAPAATAA